MGSLRSASEWTRYERYKAEGGLAGGCVLCKKEEELIKEFRHWRILKNIFPYDRIAKVHHIVTPRRHVAEVELLPEELQELKEMKEGYIGQEYEFVIEGTRKMRSVPEHYHLHLVIAKD